MSINFEFTVRFNDSSTKSWKENNVYDVDQRMEEIHEEYGEKCFGVSARPLTDDEI